MKKLALLFWMIFLVFGNDLFAQDTLPRFSLRNVGNKRVVVEWHNRFENIRQISIQRSTDSLKNFKTILTIANPALPENGYLDTKAPSDNMFYRLYIMLDKGVFLFSNTKRPVLDTVAIALRNMTTMIKADNPSLVQPLLTDSAFNGPQVTTGGIPQVPRGAKVEVWVPSKHVYTLKDGYIRITLPEEEKKYSIKFYTLRDEFLFELKDIKEKNFKIDKANFYKSGWYKFELFEDEELKEKNKFYIPKEF
ncbi:MAG: hypothetical protein ABIR18_07940 [Chitinophagaceae bacterium]